MLNPNAIEFKPPQPTAEIRKTQQRQQQQQTVGHSIPHRPANAAANAKRHADTRSGASGSGVTAGGSSSSTHKKKQPAKPRRSARTEAAPARKASQPTPASPFDQPAKFITIEEAIDPLCQLTVKDQDEKRIVHGYERYVEWIARSLKSFDTVTIVGMDNAIADVVSLVNIMQQRGIGEHEEVETFTLHPSPKRYNSCIQVKLHGI